MMKKNPTNPKAPNKKQRDVLVVASKVKAYMRSRNMNTAAETIQTVSDQVYSLLDEAICRTQANSRKTVKSHDV